VQPGSKELLIGAAAEAGPDLVAEVLRRFGRIRLRVFGGSMSPALRPGDLLDVRSTRADSLERGDVVLFRRDGRLFAHRVMEKSTLGVVTRGDAHRHDDPMVAPEDVLGIVNSVVRQPLVNTQQDRRMRALSILSLLLFDLRPAAIRRYCTRSGRRSAARA
jgi:signal peptidase I